MMEIDSPSPAASAGTPMDDSNQKDSVGGGNEQEKTLKVHPLAIIDISDHHTRVTTGGSPLPPTSPIIGLLFGYQDGLVIHIIDAIEIEYSFVDDDDNTSSSAKTARFGGGTEEQQKHHKQSIRTKIELHQKVFTQHEVIGWYRVSTDCSSQCPTEEDLCMTHGAVREYNESPLFLLMSSGAATKTSSSSSSSSSEEKQLPISIYETLLTAEESSAQPRAVFCNLEFELDTTEPERIAVEKVFHSRPPIVTKTGGSGAAGEPVRATPVPVEESGLDLQLHSLASSITSLKARVDELLTSLKSMERGETPPDYKLLRMVDGLIRQLPPERMGSWEDEFEREYRDMLMYSYLAVVTKTIKAVQGYNEKFRVVHESSKRDMRRGY